MRLFKKENHDIIDYAVIGILILFVIIYIMK